MLTTGKATMKMNRKIDLLRVDARETLDTLIELTDKPYLTAGDVRKLEASLDIIRKALAGLAEYESLITTRLAVRPCTQPKLDEERPINSKNIKPVKLVD